MTPKTLLVDMDDSVVDCEGALGTHMTRLAGPGEPPWVPFQEGQATHLRDRLDLVMARPGFWEELQPLELGMSIVRDAVSLGFHLQVLTKGPAHHPQAWAEKLTWCRRHLPGAQVAVVENKVPFHGDALLDDRPGNLQGWLDRHVEGWAIVPAQAWNEGFAHERAVRVSADDPASRQRVVEVLTMIALRGAS